MIGVCLQVIYLELSKKILISNFYLLIDLFSYLQYFATKSSPTEHLLTLWDARQESLVHMINVLNQIGRSDAACIIITHMNITH
jgi:hypothetical protein